MKTVSAPVIFSGAVGRRQFNAKLQFTVYSFPLNNGSRRIEHRRDIVVSSVQVV